MSFERHEELLLAYLDLTMSRPRSTLTASQYQLVFVTLMELSKSGWSIERITIGKEKQFLAYLAPTDLELDPTST